MIDVDEGTFTRLEITREKPGPALGTFTFQMRGVGRIRATDRDLPMVVNLSTPYGPSTPPLQIRKGWHRGPR
jgi:hypothetical protein